ncbi:hypothetical protein GYMLUDRAFT_787821 [Collybiopsis luxurians FD-317 M1]|nr:hypothetical protein GYMLUDRAFT_787821 [Collybiopsis luxurians FD-317 M1]
MIKTSKLLEYFRRIETSQEITHLIIETVASPHNRYGYGHRLRSHTIMQLLSLQPAISKFEERRQLYQTFQATYQLSVSRGWLFEGMAIDTLSRNYAGQLEPLEGGELEPLTLGTLEIRLFNNKIHPRSTVSSTHLYVPLQSNNPNWDAFCYNGNTGVGFQMTIAGKKRSPSKSGFTALHARFNAIGVARKIFVFVMPKGPTFKLPPLPDGIDQEWEFFILELDVSALNPDFVEQLKHPEEEEMEGEGRIILPEREEEEEEGEEEGSEYYYEESDEEDL